MSTKESDNNGDFFVNHCFYHPKAPAFCVAHACLNHCNVHLEFKCHGLMQSRSSRDALRAVCVPPHVQASVKTDCCCPMYLPVSMIESHLAQATHLRAVCSATQKSPATPLVCRCPPKLSGAAPIRRTGHSDFRTAFSQYHLPTANSLA